MTVYSVSVSVYGEGETVAGVFDNEKDAIACADAVSDGDYVYVDKWDTIRPTEAVEVYNRVLVEWADCT